MSRVGLFAGRRPSTTSGHAPPWGAVMWTLNATVNAWDANPPEGEGIPSGLAVLASMLGHVALSEFLAILGPAYPAEGTSPYR